MAVLGLDRSVQLILRRHPAWIRANRGDPLEHGSKRVKGGMSGERLCVRWKPLQCAFIFQASMSMEVCTSMGVDLRAHPGRPQGRGAPLPASAPAGPQAEAAGRGLIPGRVDISEQPGIVNEKCRVGVWEVDTVIGAGCQGVPVTAGDRMSKFTLIEAVECKTENVVGGALVAMLEPVKDFVLTVTATNGKECAGHADVAAALEADMYFARPYHSWERGLNERANGLIRQYFGKSESLLGPDPGQVRAVADLLNRGPRKALGFRSPAAVLRGSPRRLTAPARLSPAHPARALPVVPRRGRCGPRARPSGPCAGSPCPLRLGGALVPLLASRLQISTLKVTLVPILHAGPVQFRLEWAISRLRIHEFWHGHHLLWLDSLPPPSTKALT